MYREHRVTVVIPAYNEERHISAVVTTLPDYVDEIIVVDDCSTDKTFETVASIRDERLVLLQNSGNQGVGGSMINGYQKALEGSGDIIVKMDGDGQMSPDYLPQLLDAIVDQGVEYAKGNRFLMAEALSSMPRHRQFGNIVLTVMTKLASGYWHIFDYQNGFTAIRASALRRIPFARVHQRFFFENDMLIQLSLQRARVKDVAMPSRYADEQSSLNLAQIMITFPILLLKRFFSRVWHNYFIVDFSPVALFLYSGLLLSGWGVVFGLYLWANSAITGNFTSTGTVMLCVLPLILGFQLLLQAIVLDIQEEPR